MKEKYDVIIIGAGIGGLVCGCYLAKAGIKVLIAEKHFQVGGYCTSFKRNGFTFDSGAHSLGSLRKGGIIRNIISELNLTKDIAFTKAKNTDKIITPNCDVSIYRDIDKTKLELIKSFPKEKRGIDRLFKFILSSDLLEIVGKTKRKNFTTLIDSFINDSSLKTTLSVLLANLGLPPSRASALVSTFLFREFIFDGGYYPKGGIQAFPDALSSKFQEYGGTLKLSSRVDGIVTHNGKAKGVEINKTFIDSKFVISNIDAGSTFNKLIKIKTTERKKANNLQCSISAFVVFLGLKKKLQINQRFLNIWHLNSVNLEEAFAFKKDLKNLANLDLILCTFSSRIDPSVAPVGKETLRLFSIAKFSSKKKWDGYKATLRKKIIERAESILPGLKGNIELSESATPWTFYRYTGNKKGAIFGWSSIPTQVDQSIFPSQTSVKNLFLTGHWVSTGLGHSSIPLVALSGKNTAEKIIKKRKK